MDRSPNGTKKKEAKNDYSLCIHEFQQESEMLCVRQAPQYARHALGSFQELACALQRSYWIYRCCERRLLRHASLYSVSFPGVAHQQHTGSCLIYVSFTSGPLQDIDVQIYTYIYSSINSSEDASSLQQLKFLLFFHKLMELAPGSTTMHVRSLASCSKLSTYPRTEVTCIVQSLLSDREKIVAYIWSIDGCLEKYVCIYIQSSMQQPPAVSALLRTPLYPKKNVFLTFQET